jgi:hydroxymethylbilane synthase
MARLAERGVACELLEVSTHGDRVLDRPLAALGDDGIFVKELERALRERRADLAVHSCKDLPSVQPDDMRLAAILERADPRDAFCSERYGSFDELPAGASVGTSSPRRRAQLAALRADLRYDDLRGNVDTRLRKLREGRYDAIVLAVAGLERLGVRARHTVPFESSTLLGAAGQGALAVECREDDADLAERLHDILADPKTERAVAAERAVLRGLDAGCQAPIGAQAREREGTLELVALAARGDGARVLRASARAPVTDLASADALGMAVARMLRADGADDVLGRASPLAGTLFLLARTRGRESRIGPALRSAGAEVVEAHDEHAAHAALGSRVPDVLLFPSSGSVATLGAYLRDLRADGCRPLVAAMGPASAAAASDHGFPPDAVASEPAVAAFVQTITQLALERTITP